MLAKLSLNWLTAIAVVGSFGGFIFSGICVSDTSWFQLESMLIFIESVLFAASVVALRRVLFRLVDDDWRFTAARVTALAGIFLGLALAIYYQGLGLWAVRERLEM